MSKSELFFQKSKMSPHQVLLFDIQALLTPWRREMAGRLYVR